MIKHTDRQAGFTLIELMIVVAIIGILAAIAVPNFLSMQLRAKRSEVPTNLSAVRTTEQAYFHEFDTYTNVGLQPRNNAALNTQQTAWGTYSDWTPLGWAPDGQVRGNYGVSGSTVSIFTATGACDVDDDSSVAIFTANQNNQPVMSTTTNIY